jgi:hypothetical protein
LLPIRKGNREEQSAGEIKKRRSLYLVQILVPLFIIRMGVFLESTAYCKLIKCVNCGLRWGTREGKALRIGNITDSACTRD